EQTPLFIQEYLNWIFWDNLMTVIIYLLVFLVCGTVIFTTRKSMVYFAKDEYYQDEKEGKNLSFIHAIIGWCAAALFGVLLLAFLCHGIPSVKEMVKVKVAPRVILV